MQRLAYLMNNLVLWKNARDWTLLINEAIAQTKIVCLTSCKSIALRDVELVITRNSSYSLSWAHEWWVFITDMLSSTLQKMLSANLFQGDEG